MDGDKSTKFFLSFFVLVFVLSLLLIISSYSDSITGHALSFASSNVTITSYFAFTLSNNLTNGIGFGSVSVLPFKDLNATSNNDTAFPENGTTYFANVSTDSNTAVDFCLNGTDFLSGADVLGVNNFSYNNASFTNRTFHPNVSIGGYNLTYTLTKASLATFKGNSTFWRFWLDLPAAQPAGTYTNNVTVEGVATAGAC